MLMLLHATIAALAALTQLSHLAPDTQPVAMQANGNRNSIAMQCIVDSSSLAERITSLTVNVYLYFN